MNRSPLLALPLLALLLAAGCSTAYQAQPTSFKAPENATNTQAAAGTLVSAEAFADEAAAKKAFGFDIRGAGMLPVQLVFDNRSGHPVKVNGGQTFLEDKEGNLWPLLTRETAQKRALKYAETKQIFSEGAYGGFLGGVAGAVIGAAVGVVSGHDVGSTIGKGAVIGAAAGATLGGAGGAGSSQARREITGDLQAKSLENRPVPAGGIAHGFLFFPGEAKSATRLRLQLIESDSGKNHLLLFDL
ncbi:hypothetical protein [Endothiovibrio diazotrophicus]